MIKPRRGERYQSRAQPWESSRHTKRGTFHHEGRAPPFRQGWVALSGLCLNFPRVPRALPWARMHCPFVAGEPFAGAARERLEQGFAISVDTQPFPSLGAPVERRRPRRRTCAWDEGSAQVPHSAPPHAPHTPAAHPRNGGGGAAAPARPRLGKGAVPCARIARIRAGRARCRKGVTPNPVWNSGRVMAPSFHSRPRCRPAPHITPESKK